MNYNTKVILGMVDLGSLKEVMEALNKDNFNSMRSTAMNEWLDSDLPNVDRAAAAWCIAVVTSLQARGFEIKKKEEIKDGEKK